MADSDTLSVIRGGPLFRFLRRASLSGDDLELLRRRIALGVVLTWLPLFLLAIWEGTASGDRVGVTFFGDVDVHTRLLVALPLLLLAETVVHRRMSKSVRQFLERGLIPEDAKVEFDAAMVSARRLRDSFLAEAVLVAIVCVVSAVWFLPQRTALGLDGWYGVMQNGQLHRSWAGWWLSSVSLPLFQFLVLRWYFRLFIWGRFLRRVSRIELVLLPTHPDRAGGLGFLGTACYSFGPLLVAHGVMFTGTLANIILHTGRLLPHYKAEIIGLVTLALLFVLGPMLAFVPRLLRVKRAGLREYGTLAQRYVRSFDQKWVRGGAAPSSDVLGTVDIQSLADLDHSYAIIRAMRWTPFSLTVMIRLAVTTAAPMSFLLLTLMPLGDLLEQLVRIVLGRG